MSIPKQPEDAGFSEICQALRQGTDLKIESFYVENQSRRIRA
ncbi:hypothetical protein [Vibrio quintilis]|nr:hypothetical protein [Vibrio quintilis]